MSEDGISGIKSPVNIRIQLQTEEQVVIVTIQAAD